MRSSAPPIRSLRQLSRRLFLSLVATLIGGTTGSIVLAQDDDPVFSGPQAGEPVTGFEAELFGGGDEVTLFDPIKDAENGPFVLIFMHEFTRPSFALMRSSVEYAKSLAEKGLSGAVIYLSDDATAMKAQLTRASGALPKEFKIGVYTEGLEGPGAYGLNRNVSMTVLVGKENEVMSNFALIQPSLQADGYAIVKAIAAATGVEPPDQQAYERQSMRGGRRPAMNERMQAKYRSLISPVIQKDSDEATINAAAEKLEAAAADDPELRKMVGDATRRIVNGGRLENYGNAFSQAWIKKWSEEYK